MDAIGNHFASSIFLSFFTALVKRCGSDISEFIPKMFNGGSINQRKEPICSSIFCVSGTVYNTSEFKESAFKPLWSNIKVFHNPQIVTILPILNIIRYPQW